MPKPKKFKYRDECIAAYEQFDPKPVVGDLEIEHIPKLPKHTEIDNYGLPRKDRKFKYIELPEVDFQEDDGGNIMSSHFTGLSQEEEAEFLTKVWKHMTDGYFWYNGDKLEYITGLHWYFLNFIKLDIAKEVDGELLRITGNPHYIDGHRDVFYFWRQCEIEPRCFGMLLITRRRFAKTSIALTICLQAALTRHNAKVGLQAQTGDVAQDNFDKIVDMWRELPRHPFFFPTHAGSDSPAKKLELRNPTRRSAKSQHLKSKEVLNSWIGFKTTKPNAYDGAGLWRYYLDEASKIEECDVNELYDIVRESMSSGSKALGKMIITSTAENISGKTLPKFEKMWENSDLELRNTNALKLTSSGLYRLFVPADIGYTHDQEEDGNLPDELNISTVDEFGYSNREVARKVILEMRKLKSGDELIRYTRKYPLTITEAFAVEKGECPFNVHKINDQEKYNRDLDIKPTKGNFEWVGSEKKEVVFYPSEKGKWEVAWMPPEDYRCRVTRSAYEGIVPSVNECYTGVDPYEADTTVEKGSDGAISTWANTGVFFQRPTKVCRYVHRPPTAEALFDDVLKQSVFYSSKILAEVNAGRGLIRYIKAHKFAGFLLPDPLYPIKHRDGCHTRNEDTRNTMVNKLRTYIEENIGIVNDDTYEHGQCDFNNTLKEWKNFEAGNWTPYDDVVADMLALHAIPQKIYRPKKYSIDDLVKVHNPTTYGNSGRLF